MSEPQHLMSGGPLTLKTQLKNIIQKKISSGEWAPNTMIPSENKLSEIYGASRMTVRNVITEFVHEGYLSRVPGKGTFVNENKYVISSLDYSGLRGQLEAQGHDVATALMSCERIHASDYIAKKLNIMSDDIVYKIMRTRSVNALTISYHESYIPARLCPGLEGKSLQDEQLCHIMSTKYSVTRDHMVETLETNLADEEVAGYMAVDPGFPLILLQDVLYSADNTAFEYSRVYFRGDRMKLRIEYKG